MPPAHLTPSNASPNEVADAMWSRDHATQHLGMAITQIDTGRATITMTVRREMLNGHGMCHGGYLFTLADSAFAYACNTYNLNTVASGCSIEFLAPAREGDVLEAVAEERSLAGRTGVYDVTVRVIGGKTVALFRGKSYRIQGEVIAGLQAAQAQS